VTTVEIIWPLVLALLFWLNMMDTTLVYTLSVLFRFLFLDIMGNKLLSCESRPIAFHIFGLSRSLSSLWLALANFFLLHFLLQSFRITEATSANTETRAN
jgi:hypothetical protein